MSAAHTPPPWIGSGTTIRQDCGDRLGPTIARVAGPEGDPETDANLRLIAEAPALVQALDRLLEAMADSECADPGKKYPPEALAAAREAEDVLARAIGHDWREVEPA